MDIVIIHEHCDNSCWDQFQWQHVSVCIQGEVGLLLTQIETLMPIMMESGLIRVI